MEVILKVVVAVVGVLDVGAVEVACGAPVRGDSPRFSSLPLPRPEPDCRPTINDLYNICMNQ